MYVYQLYIFYYSNKQCSIWRYNLVENLVDKLVALVSYPRVVGSNRLLVSYSMLSKNIYYSLSLIFATLSILAPLFFATPNFTC